MYLTDNRLCKTSGFWFGLIYTITVYVSVYSTIVNISPHLQLSFFRDIAGHERFGHMTRVYYKYAYALVTK